MMVNGLNSDSVDLDLRGLKCPLPAMKARKALQSMTCGQVLRVLATDPMSIIDIPHMVSETKNELLCQSRQGDILSFEIRRL